MVLVCLPVAAPIGLSPPLIRTLCGSERVLVVSTEPPDDLSCLTTPGVGRPGDGVVACAVDQGHPDAHTPSPCGGLLTPALTCARRWWGNGGGGGTGTGCCEQGTGDVQTRARVHIPSTQMAHTSSGEKTQTKPLQCRTVRCRSVYKRWGVAALHLKRTTPPDPRTPWPQRSTG